MNLVAEIEFHGLENLPKSGGYMLASNHLGRLDSFIVYCAIDNDDIIHPIADKYKYHPVLGLIGRWMGATWLKRGEADFESMREMLSRLQKGAVMVMAPEGTRSQGAQLLQGKPGAVFLASRARVPVIPIALTGTEDRRSKGLFRFQRLHITANVGEAFIPPQAHGRNRDQALQAATDEIMCRIAALLPESYRGFYKDHARVKELLAHA
jgi:1-acyl-sn-glycerol-3-phosphate acyltransferase